MYYCLPIGLTKSRSLTQLADEAMGNRFTHSLGV